MSDYQLELFGTPRLHQHGAPVAIERRKALALLAYLAVQRAPVSREALAALLFEDADSSKAAAYIRNAIYTLNKALGEAWCVQDGERIGIHAPTFRVDVWDFEAAAHSTEAEALAQASTLYKADFLAHFVLPDAAEWQAWQTTQAQLLRQDYARVLERLVMQQAQAADYDAATHSARRLVALDELNESAHQLLLRCYGWAGQTSAATRHYQDAARLLRQELGIALSGETERLMAAIRAGELPAPQAKPVNLGAERTNRLPSPATPFIGRTHEREAILKLLHSDGCRLLTLVGQGGIGKTRLALQVAAEVGIPAAFVALAPVGSGEFILGAVAQALGFEIDPRNDHKQQLVHALREAPLLLVMDNFEHLLDEAGIVSDLLEAAPHLTILATSRERLGLREEWLYELGGLTYPWIPGQQDAPASYAAYHLFVETARRQGFHPQPSDAPAILRICQLVEGMPLALELAATWTPLLSCAEIAAEIEHNVDILSTNLRHVPERHRSLRAIFEQAWQRLSAAEQDVLARISVLHGGFSSDAAQAITGASLHSILSLTQKSLLRRGLNGRYEMHELLRQYAAQKADPSQRQAAQARHADYYLGYLQRYTEALQGAGYIEACNAIGKELENIRAAWLYCAEQGAAMRLSAALFPLQLYLIVRGNSQEMAELMQRATLHLDEHKPDHQLLLGRLLAAYATTSRRGEWFRAPEPDLVARTERLLRPYMHLAEGVGSLVLLGEALNLIGFPDDEAVRLLDDSIQHLQAIGAHWNLAYAYFVRGRIAHTHIRYAEGRAYLQQALALYQQLGYGFGIILCHWQLANTAWTLGELDEGRRLLEASRPYVYAMQNPAFINDLENSLIWYGARGNTPEQIDRLRQQLAELEAQADPTNAVQIAWTKYEMATVSFFIGRYETARPLFEEIRPTFEAKRIQDGGFWANCFLAWMAVKEGRFADVEPLLQRGLACILSASFPWGVCGADFVRGEAALAQGQREVALGYYLQATRLAHQVQSMVQVMRHLGGIAATWAQMGRTEAAYALALFIHQHQSRSADAVDRMTALSAQLEAHLPPPIRERLRAEAATQTLEGVMAQLG